MEQMNLHPRPPCPSVTASEKEESFISRFAPCVALPVRPRRWRQEAAISYPVAAVAVAMAKGVWAKGGVIPNFFGAGT